MKQPQLATARMAALLTASLAVNAQAQDTKFDELKRATDDISALIAAENSKSEICKSYVGQTVAPAAFAALVGAVPKLSEKSEFETTEQYRERIAAAEAQAPAGPYIVNVPVKGNYVRYDADIQAMFVEAGAFGAGQYSDETLADLTAWGAKDAAESAGSPMFHSRGEAKATKSYSTTSRSGVPFRVTEFERHTNSLYVTATELFPFAKRKDSPVMGLDVPLARAPKLKGTLKLALVVKPRSPYLYKNAMGPIVPSLGTPNVYKEFVTVAIVEAQCGLALDEQNRVVASADVGS